MAAGIDPVWDPYLVAVPVVWFPRTTVAPAARSRYIVHIDGWYYSELLKRKAKLAPRFDPSAQRADSSNTSSQQEKRRTGAGGFVWSRTVEDDLFIARDHALVHFQACGVDPSGRR